MFTRFILSTFLFLGCASLLSASTLVWDKTEVHLEMTPDQEEIRETFTVTNKGDKVLRIARIKTSCGCTGSIINNKIIELGGSTEVVATFHKGKRRPGLNSNKLQVYLDNQADPVVTLLMNVTIPTLIEASPTFVHWESDSSKTERRVRLKLDGKYINEILRIEYDRSQLKVTEEPGKPSEGVDRVLVIEPMDYAKRYRGSITIYGSGPEGRKADLRVPVFVQP